MPDLLGIVKPVFLDERHELELDDVGKAAVIDKLSVVAEETAVSDGKAASEALVGGDLAVELSDDGDQLFDRGGALFLKYGLERLVIEGGSEFEERKASAKRVVEPLQGCGPPCS